MELPDCDVFEDDLILSYKENIELITKLVEEGPDYLDRFLLEQSKKEGNVARYIKRMRERLAKQAAKIRHERKKGHLERMKELEKKRAAQKRVLSSEVMQLSKEQKALQDMLDDIFSGELLADNFVKMVISAPLDLEEEEESIGRRILSKIVGFFVKVGSAIKRFFVWLAGKFRRRKAEPEDDIAQQRSKLLLAFPSISGGLDDIDSRFGNALFTSPNLQKKMEKNMLKGKRFRKRRLKWRRKYLKKKYVEDAKRTFYDNLQRRMQNKAQEVETKKANLKKRSKDLKVKEQKTKEELKAHEEKLKKKRKKEEEDIKAQVESIPKEKVKSKIREKLETSGYIAGEGKELSITSSLIDRFANIVLTAEIQNIPTAYHAIYGASDVEGIYERARLRTVDEISRMDIVESMVNARIRHPSDRHIYEDDVITYRDKRGANNHVVLMFDKSGSMDENDRIVAAKKAVLALYKAVKEKNPQNIVDLVAFDTEVSVMDLLGVWQSEPKGFTNTGEALKTAKELLSDSNADRKLVYLITDGLPEAYTHEGRSIAGDTKASLEYAVSQAKDLSYVSNLHLTMILLEEKEKIYVDAAEKIVTASNGRAVVVEPQELAAEMIMDFIAV
jgi:Mg-chelatase subunit ChlD